MSNDLFEETVTLRLETYLGIRQDIADMVEDAEFSRGKIGRLESDIMALEEELYDLKQNEEPDRVLEELKRINERDSKK